MEIAPNLSLLTSPKFLGSLHGRQNSQYDNVFGEQKQQQQSSASDEHHHQQSGVLNNHRVAASKLPQAMRSVSKID